LRPEVVIMRRWLAGLPLAALTLSGCVMAADIRSFDERKPVGPVGESRPIMFRRLVSRIPSGHAIGAVQVGIFCEGRQKLLWRRPEGAPVGDDTLARSLTDELSRTGYKAIGATDSLFDDPQEWQAEFLLGGSIKHIAWNVCHMFANSSGEASVEIEWQVFERRTRSVVLTATTGGTAKVGQTTGGGDKAFYGAFTAALRNFLAEPRFASLMSTTPSAGTRPDTSPLSLQVVGLSGDVPASAALIDYARNAVVTIPVGTGHGSGFVVSRVGLALTNAHVVGTGDGSVRLQLADGRSVTGRVLRVDRETDVALIQLDAGDYPAAPIGSSQSLKVGDAVFAIGTPLNERFSRTVTKGVVSAFRTDGGRRLIQSDVSVHPGSSGGPLLDDRGRVVGLALAGVMAGGRIGVGLNTFVPIEEAWKALGATPVVSSIGAAPAAGRDADAAEKLRLIQELRDKGLITSEEAEQRRKEVLDRALR